METLPTRLAGWFEKRQVRKKELKTPATEGSVRVGTPSPSYWAPPPTIAMSSLRLITPQPAPNGAPPSFSNSTLKQVLRASEET